MSMSAISPGPAGPTPPPPASGRGSGEPPILSIRDVAVSFRTDDGVVEAVRGVSMDLFAGETVAVVGESGSGKSVTARTVMRLLPRRAVIAPGSRVEVEGLDVIAAPEREMRRLRGNTVSMIFQEPMSSLNPVYTIGRQIEEILHLHNRLSAKEAKARAIGLLDEVRLPDPEARYGQYPHQMSGGQRQRVMIAMALANRPDILIADEPTTALDVTVQAQILHLIRDLQRAHGMAVILITHDLTVVRQFADHVYVMQRGEVQEEGRTERIFTAPQHPYTRHLLASEPKGEPGPLDPGAGTIMDAARVRVVFELKSGGMFSRRTKELVAVNDLDMIVRRGETVGLVGESGSGKTTFGMSLVRLLAAQAERIAFEGTDIRNHTRAQMKPLRKRMQVVFQDPFSSLNPRMTVSQIVGEGLVVNGMGDRGERADRVAEALRESGLPDTILDRFPHEFSGGQRQRIAIARAIVMRPDFILLDEPTSALDLSVQAQIIDLLRELRETHGLSYVFISHDLKVVRALCHRIMVMQHGQLVEEGPTAEVMDRPRTEYMRRLIRAAFEVAA